MRRAAGIALVVLVVLGAAGFLGAPFVLRKAIENAAGSTGTLETSIGSARVEWRRGAVSLRDVRVRDRLLGTDVLESPQILVRWKWASLRRMPHLAVHVREARIHSVSRGGTPSEVLRRRLLAARPVWLDEVRVEGPLWTLWTRGRSVHLRDASLVLTDARNRPVREGEPPLRVSLQGRLAPGGSVRVDASGDPLAATPEVHIRLDGDALGEGPGAVGRVLGAQAHVGMEGRVRGREFTGTARADVALPRPDVPSDALRLPGGPGSFGVERSVSFAGRLPQDISPAGVLDEFATSALERLGAAGAVTPPRGRRPWLPPIPGR